MNKPIRIGRVSAMRFRGATTSTVVDFDTSKSFVLLYGENGSGKSTIVDAIDFVCNQNLGSVREISSADAGHVPSIGSKASDVKVAINTTEKSWSGLLKGTKVSTTPSDTPNVTVLRRNKILALVTATPSKRYEELKRFVDVENVQKSEEGLEALRKDIEKTVNEKSSQLTSSQENLINNFRENRTQDENTLDANTWAKKRLAQTSTDLAARIEILNAVIAAEDRAQLFLEQRNKRQPELNEKRQQRDAIKQKIQNEVTIDAETGILLVSLLAKAEEYLVRKPDTNKCPVCLQSKDSLSLSVEIKDRLSTMSEMKTLAQKMKEAEDDVKIREQSMQKLYTDYVQSVFDLFVKVNELNVCEQTSPPQISSYPALSQWNGTLTKGNIADTNRFMTDVGPFLQQVQKVRNELQRQQAQYNTIKRDFESCISLQDELKNLYKLKEHLEKMLLLMRQERLAFTQKILDDVAEECDRLYSLIHPDEGVGKVRLCLDESKRASLEQYGEFCGHKNIVPQGYFSESHLDTLGFALFMAVTKKITGGNSIIVLDDVFTSVDLNHIERLLLMLLDESQNYHQLVFTTHQRRWLQFFEINKAPRNKADVICLRQWDLKTGVRSNRITTLVERLEELLINGALNRREIGNTGGYIIESVLEEMTKYLNCTVKRNPENKYTCAPLLDSMKKPAKVLQFAHDDGDGINPSIDTTLEPLITELRSRITDARNTVGDHFNWDAADITENDILNFGRNALSLARRFICPDCGGMPIREKNSILKCSCGKFQIVKAE